MLGGGVLHASRSPIFVSRQILPPAHRLAGPAGSGWPGGAGARCRIVPRRPPGGVTDQVGARQPAGFAGEPICTSAAASAPGRSTTRLAVIGPHPAVPEESVARSLVRDAGPRTVTSGCRVSAWPPPGATPRAARCRRSSAAPNGSSGRLSAYSAGSIAASGKSPLIRFSTSSGISLILRIADGSGVTRVVARLDRLRKAAPRPAQVRRPADVPVRLRCGWSGAEYGAGLGPVDSVGSVPQAGARGEQPGTCGREDVEYPGGALRVDGGHPCP